MSHPTSLSAVTLHVADMARSTAFYDALGFRLGYGGPTAAFTSYVIGGSFLNLQLHDDVAARGWGRAIVHVADVDGMHDRVLKAGFHPEMAPSDAPWGERYFHVLDPDGHELSFARPLADGT